MKSLVIVLIFFCGSYYSQIDTLITYFDEDWEIATVENHQFYRETFLEESNWHVLDYYKSGVPQMKGSYLDKSLELKNGQFVYFKENGNKISENWYVNNKKEGAFAKYRKNGTIASKGNYKNDSLVDYVFFNEREEKLKGDFPFMVEPVYPGGMNELFKDLTNNLKYPTVAIDNNLQGKVLVSFIIEKDGSISNVYAKNHIHRVLDDEAIRVVKSLKKWAPGMEGNLPVRVVYNLPVRFKLFDVEGKTKKNRE